MSTEGNYREAGDIVDMNGRKFMRLPDKINYNYAKDKSKCMFPGCSGLGVPWNGWMECENCGCRWLLETGEGFLPLKGTI